MAIAAAAVIVPIGVLFFVSGLIVNLIQAIIFVTVHPFSKSLFRRINRQVAELLWLELVWIVDWWAGVKGLLLLHVSKREFRTLNEYLTNGSKVTIFCYMLILIFFLRV
ncbi:putative 1-acylglycerol-3-phosphate O-acyltransferase [Helianthus annuus]|nr:putative 1-acylglycerol-3-phosphate O-acyltransferase [Helianthus annuus]